MQATKTDFNIDIQQAEKLMDIEQELHALDEQREIELLAISAKYALLKQPILQKRDNESKMIPNFWATALFNNSFMQSLVFPKEQPVLKLLDAVSIERHGDRDFTLSFTFKKNDYFTNTILSKKVVFDRNDDASVVPAKIQWNKGKKFFTPKKSQKHDHEHSHEETGFFGWLEDTDSCSANIAMFISEELYPNAGKFYAGEGEDSEEEGEDDDEDDDEDESMSNIEENDK